jgi:hypothetical protein
MRVESDSEISQGRRSGTTNQNSTDFGSTVVGMDKGKGSMGGSERLSIDK